MRFGRASKPSRPLGPPGSLATRGSRGQRLGRAPACTLIDSDPDKFSGGPPQLASLFRIGAGRPHGAIWKNRRYFEGLPTISQTAKTGVPWRNNSFEIVDPKTASLAAGAPRQISHLDFDGVNWILVAVRSRLTTNALLLPGAVTDRAYRRRQFAGSGRCEVDCLRRRRPERLVPVQAVAGRTRLEQRQAV